VLAGELESAGLEIATIACRCCWLTSYQSQPWPLAALRLLRFAWPDGGGRRLGWWLGAVQPDVVYVNCLPHLRGAAEARRNEAPVVWHLREIMPPGARRRWFAARLRRHASHIVAVSQAVASWLDEEGLGGRTTVVHNGIETAGDLPRRGAARQQLGLADGEVAVGLIGQMVPHKGTLDFVAAAAAAAARRPELVFLIAGSGKPAFVAEVAARIERLGLAGRIRLLPPRPEVWSLLAALDGLAVTSLVPDPLPRSVLEGMCAGLPVVGYRAGGVPEMVLDGETGWLVEVGDVTGLAALFGRLTDGPEAARRLGAAGRVRALKEFSLAGHVAKMDQLLAAVAAEGSGR
jgi:glycosyltransferase involved in cell wall biosynthesis